MRTRPYRCELRNSWRRKNRDRSAGTPREPWSTSSKFMETITAAEKDGKSIFRYAPTIRRGKLYSYAGKR